MPRPSRKTERRHEILLAYERCLGQFGVDGTTLERVAEEAGLARALIRHNVGNKEDLLDAFVDNFLARSNASGKAFIDSLPTIDPVAAMLHGLFDPAYSDPHSVNVTTALLIAASDRPLLARRLRKWTADFTDSIASVLQQAHAVANSETIEVVATGISAIYFHFDSMAPIGDRNTLQERSLRAAERLAGTLPRR
ncbi:MAG: TetR/AcrR family transcriptional regulator [Pseudomonadota bacterium]